MQFSTVALFAVVAAVNAGVVTEVDTQSTLVTITDCDSTVTDCPAHTSAPVSSAPAVNSTSAPANTTAAGVSTYEGAAVANGQYAAGFAALAAGALLAL
ncbi:unnamed protein product [Debaryomyces tyrocola]|nr:unnamed protein product [Debaryomyces tyrocola]